MTNSLLRSSFLLALGLVLTAAAPASAQLAFLDTVLDTPWTGKGFVNVSIGSQPASRTYSTSGSMDIYEEVATFTSDLRTKGQAIPDLAGGYRVWRNLAAAVGFSRYSSTVDTVVNARVPDYLVFNTLHESSLPVTGLAHKETSVHLSAAYMLPVTSKIDVMVFLGPSFISLDKDVVTGITVPDQTSTISDATVTNVSKSATAFHIGVDVSYRLMDRIGAGVFLRQAGASVDVPEVEGGKVDVGGFAFGVGVRVRF